MTTPRFSTNAFRFSHGKAPRGTGCWAFRWNGVDHFAPGTMTYTDAKAWAAKQARADGAYEVEVCS